MPGVPRELVEHCLHHVNPNARPVKPGLCKFHDDRRKIIGEEVARLLAAEFIKEVFHPEWVANPVLVPKKTGELRMCIDFTGLNKHYPTLPRIDQIIDSTAGSEVLCF